MLTLKSKLFCTFTGIILAQVPQVTLLDFNTSTMFERCGSGFYTVIFNPQDKWNRREAG